MKKKETKKESKKEGNGLFKGVSIAYAILMLHVVLLAVLGGVVLFFHGIVNYMLWVFVAAAIIALYCALRLKRRLKAEKENLKELLQLPEFAGRNVEVSLLGGFASLKMSGEGPKKEEQLLLQHEGTETEPRRLEDPTSRRIRDLRELARLFENDLITFDEYQKTKEQLLHGTTG